MLTPNYCCVGAAGQFTSSDTVFTSLVMFYFKLTIVTYNFYFHDINFISGYIRD